MQRDDAKGHLTSIQLRKLWCMIHKGSPQDSAACLFQENVNPLELLYV